MKEYKKLAHNQGSSLIEILISTFIVGTILTTVAAGLTYSVKLSSKAKLRSTATRLAQEGMEIFKRENVIRGWDTFQSDYTTCAGGCKICMSSANFPAAGDGIGPLYSDGGNCDEDFELDVARLATNFEREAIVTSGNDGTVDFIAVQVTVSWAEPNLTSNPSVIVSREFREW